MLDLPDDLDERHRMITEYLTACRVASLCRPGDRIVELTSRASALLPLLVRQDIRPHSFTVLHDAGFGVGDDLPFPVARRNWDGLGPWPVAGPFDLAVDTSATARPAAFVLRTIKNAATFLTVGSRLALSAPATITDLSVLLRSAGFTVDEIYGIDPPGDDERVEHVLRTRFGSGSIAFYRAMRLNCEPGFVQPVIATCLAEDAATVLRICRRTQNDETTPTA